MKKRMNTLINSTACGILIGLMTTLIVNYSIGSQHYLPSGPQFVNRFALPLNALLVSVILWGLMGFLFGLGSFIFDIQTWSLAKQTIVNFIVYYGGFTILAICAGWFSLSWVNFGTFSLMFIVIYALIWMINKRAKNYQ